MIDFQSPHINIKKIHLAHDVVLDKNNKFTYPNGRKSYGIIYCIDGEAEYKFSSKKLCTIHTGEIIILSPEAAYSIFTKNSFTHYTINFEIHSKFSNINFLEDDYYLFHPEDPQLYSNLFNKLVTRWVSRKTCFEMSSIASLYELFSFLFAEILEKEYSTTSYLRLNSAKEYIEQHYNRNITLDILANKANMSVSNFRREWLKLYGESALQYRDKIRLSYAEKYLMCGYYTVTEIAEKCGFENVNYFIRFFKKNMGISPGKFKKLL